MPFDYCTVRRSTVTLPSYCIATLVSSVLYRSLFYWLVQFNLFLLYNLPAVFVSCIADVSKTCFSVYVKGM